MTRWIETAGVILFWGSAGWAQEPEHKLGESGESCRVSADCAGLPCVDGVCGTAKHAGAATSRDQENPVERYRALSFSLLSDAAGTLSVTTGNGTTQFLMALGVSARGVIQGFVIGAQLSGEVVNVSTGAGPSSTQGYMLPGVQFGYAIALGERVAHTPSVRAQFLVPLTNGSGQGTFLGEIAVEIFLGAHGFIEPFLAAGELQDFGAGQGSFAFSVGYRLGVVF